MNTPYNVFSKPKKAKLQNKLTASCAAKRATPISRVLLLGDRHTKNNAKPIKMYKVVQTGPNTQLGGVNQGLFNVVYHVEIAGVVTSPPIPPTSKGTPIDMISFMISLGFIWPMCYPFLYRSFFVKLARLDSQANRNSVLEPPRQKNSLVWKSKWMFYRSIIRFLQHPRAYFHSWPGHSATMHMLNESAS